MWPGPQVPRTSISVVSQGASLSPLWPSLGNITSTIVTSHPHSWGEKSVPTSWWKECHCYIGRWAHTMKIFCSHPTKFNTLDPPWYAHLFSWLWPVSNYQQAKQNFDLLRTVIHLVLLSLYRPHGTNIIHTRTSAAFTQTLASTLWLSPPLLPPLLSIQNVWGHNISREHWSYLLKIHLYKPNPRNINKQVRNMVVTGMTK